MSKVVMSLPKGMVKNSVVGGLLALAVYVAMQFFYALLIHRGAVGMELRGQRTDRNRAVHGGGGAAGGAGGVQSAPRGREPGEADPPEAAGLRCLAALPRCRASVKR